MASVKSRNTTPELKVRKLLHKSGFRYRLHRVDLPGKPDIVFGGKKIAVFVNGCFWHWHGCNRSRMPSTHREYWERKIARNVERDRESHERLVDLGWNVHVIWECEIELGTQALMDKMRRK